MQQSLGDDLLCVGIYATIFRQQDIYEPRQLITVTIIRQWQRYESAIQPMFLSSI